jgi:hypothetical protein
MATLKRNNSCPMCLCVVVLLMQTVWCTDGLSSKAVAAYSASVLAPEEQLIKSDEPVSGVMWNPVAHHAY